MGAPKTAASQRDYIRGYSVYSALLTQSGSSAPTVTVLENTLSAVVVWARSSAGYHVGTLTGAFPASRTSCQPVGVALTSAKYTAQLSRLTDNTVGLKVYDVAGTLADGLNESSVEIHVYPAA